MNEATEDQPLTVLSAQALGAEAAALDATDALALGRGLALLNEHIRTANVGTFAQLRRFEAPNHSPPAEARALLRWVGVVPSDEDQHHRWALLLHCLAIAKCAHSTGAEPGAVLARLHVSEARLKQLVEAHSADLQHVMPSIARRLAPGGMAVDWVPLAHLVLFTNTAHEALAQAARKRIVMHFLHQRRHRAGAFYAEPAPDVSTVLAALQAPFQPQWSPAGQTATRT
jgi:CRISPR-associated protein Cse2 (CRISPR_cse2)